jgi:hypothetical protein
LIGIVAEGQLEVRQSLLRGRYGRMKGVEILLLSGIEDRLLCAVGLRNVGRQLTQLAQCLFGTRPPGLIVAVVQELPIQSGQDQCGAERQRAKQPNMTGDLPPHGR